MDDTRLTIRPAAALTVGLEDVRALLEAGNGDAALLFLHALQNGGVLDPDRAARELHRSDRDIETAAGRLREMGLLSPGGGRREVPAPVRELPEYPAEDVVRRSKEDPRFQELVNEVQMALGRTLSSADLKKLFGIYDELAMPPEVIVLLIQHCKEELTAKYGQEKNVGFAYIEKEAYDWFHREILTYEQAERWLAELARRRSEIEKLKRQLGIHDRNLTPTERRYLDGWLSRGFPAESILMAVDRTVTKTGGLKWKYMDAIVDSWEKMGLHTPEEIEKGDKPPARRTGKSAGEAPSARDDTKTMEQVKRLREKIKNS